MKAIHLRVSNGVKDSNKLLTHERYMKMKNWYAKIFLIWTTSNYFWALEVWKIWGFQIKVVELPFYKLASNWNSEHISMEALIFILQFFKFLRFSKILSLKSWLKIVWLTQKSLFCNSLILKIHYPTHSCQKWSKQTTFIIQILANFWGPEVVGSSFYQKSICMPVLHFHVSFMG